MKLEVITVFDDKIDAFLQPLYFQTMPQAVRALLDCLDEPNHQFAKHPEDYVVYHLGSYDDETAVHSSHDDGKKLIGRLNELKPAISE